MASTGASKQAQDEHTLAELGYKQELRRDWSVMHNFGISFSIIVGFSKFFRLLFLYMTVIFS